MHSIRSTDVPGICAVLFWKQYNTRKVFIIGRQEEKVPTSKNTRHVSQSDVEIFETQRANEGTRAVFLGRPKALFHNMRSGALSVAKGGRNFPIFTSPRYPSDQEETRRNASFMPVFANRFCGSKQIRSRYVCGGWRFEKVPATTPRRKGWSPTSVRLQARIINNGARSDLGAMRGLSGRTAVEPSCAKTGPKRFLIYEPLLVSTEIYMRTRRKFQKLAHFWWALRRTWRRWPSRRFRRPSRRRMKSSFEKNVRTTAAEVSGSTYPEDVVHKEAKEQDAASGHFVQMQQFHGVQGERQAEDVVGDPVLQRIENVSWEIGRPFTAR